MQPHNEEAREKLALAMETSNSLGFTPKEGMYGEVLRMLAFKATEVHLQAMEQATQGVIQCIVEYGNHTCADMEGIQLILATSMKELLETVPLNAPIEEYLRVGESLLCRDFLMGMAEHLIKLDGPQKEGD